MDRSRSLRDIEININRFHFDYTVLTIEHLEIPLVFSRIVLVEKTMRYNFLAFGKISQREEELSVYRKKKKKDDEKSVNMTQ